MERDMALRSGSAQPPHAITANSRYFRAAPVWQAQLLERFRASHPARIVKVGGQTYPYLAGGSGGRAVLLLSGMLVGADMWFYSATALEERYRVIMPELSSATGTLAELAQALAVMLEAEGIRQAALVGYSAGGGIAQYLLQESPALVTDVVFSHCAPSSAALAPRMLKAARLARLLPLSVTRALFRRRAARSAGDSLWGAFTRAYFAERLTAIGKVELVAAMQAGAQATREYTFRPSALNNWKGRALIVSSRDDRSSFPAVPDMLARYPFARTHIFERGGHHTVLLDPERYTEIVTHFLAHTG